MKIYDNSNEKLRVLQSVNDKDLIEIKNIKKAIECLLLGIFVSLSFTFYVI